jgi:hypothetical protein
MSDTRYWVPQPCVVGRNRVVFRFVRHTITGGSRYLGYKTSTICTHTCMLVLILNLMLWFSGTSVLFLEASWVV